MPRKPNPALIDRENPEWTEEMLARARPAREVFKELGIRPDVADLAADCRRLRSRVNRLESLCGELYQVVGTMGAPVRILDAVAAAANGERIPRKPLLPIYEHEFDLSIIRETTRRNKKRTRSVRR